MKSQKLRKALLLVVSALLLMSLTVVGTIAYLTADTGVVENTFTVGNVSFDDPDDDDEIDNGLDEALVNKYGEPIAENLENDSEEEVVEVGEAPRVNDNLYKLLPNHVYTKDPTVHLKAGSESCYVFIKVLNGISDFEAATGVYTIDGASYSYTSIVDQITTESDTSDEIVDKWTPLGDNYPNIYWILVEGEAHDGTLSADQQLDFVVFEEFMIAGDAPIEDLKLNSDGVYVGADDQPVEINIQAYAIQADGFADAVAAWTAAPYQWAN